MAGVRVYVQLPVLKFWLYGGHPYLTDAIKRVAVRLAALLTLAVFVTPRTLCNGFLGTGWVCLADHVHRIAPGTVTVRAATVLLSSTALWDTDGSAQGVLLQ